jgi:hypothetical protein
VRCSVASVAVTTFSIAVASEAPEAEADPRADAYRGVTELMAAALEDTESALHASCIAMRAAGAGLLTRDRAAGTARTDIDGTDLFALVAALAWLGDQPSFAPRAAHLLDVVASAVLTH